MTVLSSCCRQSWATQYYYDVADDVICIAVDASHKKEAERFLREEFPRSRDLYEICDPSESEYQPGSDSPGEGDRRSESQQTQIELCPSTKISCRGKPFLFSGAIANREYGLTVAHATKPKEDIELNSDNDCLTCSRTVGRCLESHGNLRRQSGELLSADLAVLALNTLECAVHNTVRWPFPAGRTLQIKIYKDLNVPDDTGVMILDQNGGFQYGEIFRAYFTDKQTNLHNVLAISTKEGHKKVITQPGDSGALVISLPSNNSNVVYVYGISTGIYPERMTIANFLWDVIDELCTNGVCRTVLRNNNTVDFA